MSEYVVTARKWRPMRFEEVQAQEHVTQTLRNAVRSGRLAQAYLFSGPRGVGKTTTARILAKAVNCAAPADANPDNTCDLCREITEGRALDVQEIDGASNRGVDEIRNLREAVRYGPARARYRVFIIDEVHMLTTPAFNALLKTLEEPPPHVLFILATTEVHKVPATILSRCQRFDFRRIPLEEIAGNLRAVAHEEGISVEEEALLLLARKGDGSLRDAQSLFDQAVALCGHSVTLERITGALRVVDSSLCFRLTDAVLEGNVSAGLALVDRLVREGYDLKEFLDGVTEHVRNILVAGVTGQTALIEAGEQERARYAELAGRFGTPDLLRMLRQLGAAEYALRTSPQPRFRLEAEVVHLITGRTAPEVAEILRVVEELKKRPPDPPPPPPPPPGRPPAPLRPAPSFPRASQGEGHRPVPVPGTVPPVSEEELKARWSEFASEVRRLKVSLGSVFESVAFRGMSGGVVRVACTNQFEMDSIRKNREFLAGQLRRLFGVTARLEPELVQGGEETPPAPGGTPSPRRDAEHPVLGAIIRELGAEEVE
ncbi:MAG: DNA polymerase III subunit gamma/tau [Bacteroidota bacterium]